MSLFFNDYLSIAKLKFGCVLRSILGNSQDIMLALVPGPRRAVRQHDHWLHQDHHGGLQQGSDVPAKLDRRVASATVTKHSEA